MPDAKLEPAWQQFQETMRALRQKQRAVLDAYAKRLDAKRVEQIRTHLKGLK
mgnify:CR=1 FL=1